MNKINLGVFSELANNKADRDLRNVDLNKTDIIIEYQEPTEENNYTWYRLYASGWVEQGGLASGTSSITVDLLVTMTDTNYNILTQSYQSSGYYSTWTVYQQSLTTSLFQLQTDYAGDSKVAWYVYGKADMTGHEIIPSKAEQEEFEHRVIDFQKPTEENNYTWYRKYADGWVEQGGIISIGSLSDGEATAQTATLIVNMADTSYQVMATATTSSLNYNRVYANFGEKSTSSFKVGVRNIGGSTSGILVNWQVSGMYATEE